MPVRVEKRLLNGEPVKVLTTGSRYYDDRARVWNALVSVHALAVSMDRTLVVVVGDCRTGSDLFTRQWADRHGVEKIVYEADWDTYGRNAGPRRNRDMCRLEVPMLCLAFFQPGEENRGTKNCVRYARAYRIPVLPYGEPDDA